MSIKERVIKIQEFEAATAEELFVKVREWKRNANERTRVTSHLTNTSDGLVFVIEYTE